MRCDGATIVHGGGARMGGTLVLHRGGRTHAGGAGDQHPAEREGAERRGDPGELHEILLRT